LAGGALPRTSLGKLTELPQAPSCIWGHRFIVGERREGWGGGGEGDAMPLPENC